MRVSRRVLLRACVSQEVRLAKTIHLPSPLNVQILCRVLHVARLVFACPWRDLDSSNTADSA